MIITSEGALKHIFKNILQVRKKKSQLGKKTTTVRLTYFSEMDACNYE